MDLPDETELKKLLPGRYVMDLDKDQFVLYLEGTEESGIPFGETCSLMYIQNHEGGGGRSRSISGPYGLEDKKLVMAATEISRESWSADEEAEGEAFVTDYDKGPIVADIEVQGDRVVLKLRAFDKDVALERMGP